MDTSELVTPDEAAAMLGIAAPTVYHHLAKGHLPAKKWRRQWMIRRADVEAFTLPPRGAPRGKRRTPEPPRDERGNHA